MAKQQSELTINLAGLTVCLMCDYRPMTEQLQSWYADFLQSDSSPAVTVQIKVQAGAQFVPFLPGPWVVRSSVQDQWLFFESYFESGWVDLDRGWGELAMAPHASVENFLRVLCAYMMVERGALLVHASGIVKDGKGYVFFGPSGSGKTTTARLSSDFTILSDDMVLLRKTNGVVRAYGVPFRGELPETPRSNVNAELAGLFRLRKDDRHFVMALDRPRALAELMTCVPFVMSSPAMSQRVVALGYDLVSDVTVKELHFRKDAGFWEVVESRKVEGGR